MSKVQGKPFIQLVVDTLGDLKSDLLDLVNGSDKTPEFRSLINQSAKITGSDKNKVQFVTLETWAKVYTGYLIYNNSYCVLVAFTNNTQLLTTLNIDVTKQTFTTVKEYLDINEFRRYLEEADEHIVAGEIDSGSATEGQVLTADGQGKAQWSDAPNSVINQTNITALSDATLNSLKPGDMVIKKTGNQNHTYIVTYKEENHGICLSYYDASRVETVSYDYTDGHWVYNSTDVSNVNKLEQIKDAQGHNRFVEGNGTYSSKISGSVYCRWSLSGTHLMLVFAGTIPANTTFGGGGELLGQFTLPQWIYDKIQPVWGSYYVENKSLEIISNDWSNTDNMAVCLEKSSYGGGNYMSILQIGSLQTITFDGNFRIQFDLLIDNE